MFPWHQSDCRLSIRSVLLLPSHTVARMEDGLHRCVSVYPHQHQPNPCLYVRRRQDGGKECVIFIRLNDSHVTNNEYGGHVGYNYTKVPLILNYKNSTVKEHLCFIFLPSNGFTLTTWHYSSYTDGVQCSLMYA